MASDNLKNMFFELVVTSSKRVLQTGRSGFAPVMKSTGLRPDIQSRLEAMSGYKHLFPQGDPRNPVVRMHSVLSVSGRQYHVLSRVQDAGSDYSGRSNKIAHHIVFQRDAVAASNHVSPAHLYLDFERLGRFRTSWTIDPCEVEPFTFLAATESARPGCPTWARVAGDAGWAGALIDATAGAQPSVIVLPDESVAIALFAECCTLLPPAKRWGATFSIPPAPESGHLWNAIGQSSPERNTIQTSVVGTVFDFASDTLPAFVESNNTRLARGEVEPSWLKENLPTRKRKSRPEGPELILPSDDVVAPPPAPPPKPLGGPPPPPREIPLALNTPSGKKNSASPFVFAAMAGAGLSFLGLIVFTVVMVVGRPSSQDDKVAGNPSPNGVTPAEGSPAEGSPAEGSPAEGSPAEGSPAEGSPAETDGMGEAPSIAAAANPAVTDAPPDAPAPAATPSVEPRLSDFLAEAFSDQSHIPLAPLPNGSGPGPVTLVKFRSRLKLPSTFAQGGLAIVSMLDASPAAFELGDFEQNDSALECMVNHNSAPTASSAAPEGVAVLRLTADGLEFAPRPGFTDATRNALLTSALVCNTTPPSYLQLHYPFEGTVEPPPNDNDATPEDDIWAVNLGDGVPPSLVEVLRGQKIRAELDLVRNGNEEVNRVDFEEVKLDAGWRCFKRIPGDFDIPTTRVPLGLVLWVNAAVSDEVIKPRFSIAWFPDAHLASNRVDASKNCSETQFKQFIRKPTLDYIFSITGLADEDRKILFQQSQIDTPADKSLKGWLKKVQDDLPRLPAVAPAPESHPTASPIPAEPQSRDEPKDADANKEGNTGNTKVFSSEPSPESVQFWRSEFFKSVEMAIERDGAPGYERSKDLGLLATWMTLQGLVADSDAAWEIKRFNACIDCPGFVGREQGTFVVYEYNKPE